MSWPNSDNISPIFFHPSLFRCFIKSPTKTLSTGRSRNLNRTVMVDVSTAELAVEEPKVSKEPPSVVGGSGGVAQQTSEDLVAKAIAPVKREFIRPPPIRPCGNDSNDVASNATKSAPSNLLKEKKSKRQLKRERLQVACEMRGKVDKREKNLRYISVPRSQEVEILVHVVTVISKCRFSHDIEAFKDQKPADLEGDCPFLNNEGPCPYGLTCRFSGTHKDGLLAEAFNGQKKNPEMNGLNKDVQKLLWKNKMKFPKADAQLKLLGLLGPMKSKQEKLPDKGEGDQTPPNGSIVADENGGCEVAGDTNIKMDHSPQPPEEDDCADGTFASNELRPPKKAKSSVDENCSLNELDNGISILKKDLEKSCSQNETGSTTDCIPSETDRSLKSHPREKKLIDFREKLYLAPLTTVGNLPFRRVCKVLGADVTCVGQASEWALLRRHSSEDLFGVQICGAYPDTVTRTVELIDQECTVDFIDINMGCPIDIVVNKGAGSALLMKPTRMKGVVQAASAIVDRPITVKVRTGYFEGRNRIDSLIEDIGQWGASAAPDALQVMGNGDVFSYLDWNTHKSDCPELSTCMIARGALIKPWIFTEIKEQRHWDISSGERLNIMKDYVRFGLDHWGSDAKGVETTRHFLLEWLSYTFRYIPVGLLDVIPQRLNWRPPSYFGRDDLETLMASDSAADWVRISETLLGKVPAGFTFAPKHKSNAYDRAENG
ncbi:FMN-linked oxidoreductases superfamily protein [Actinidia rufa]|uniref:tRNA-dihydrouridine(47) synthase [NAD(P)(+)] n=1 Tax=Actinidia rufa TaxID=165716 RepID=A0A7J0FNX6_9ERIC|nr:FMN-linked oxidoreductases superfamily protein [Actinidia rufa]